MSIVAHTHTLTRESWEQRRRRKWIERKAPACPAQPVSICTFVTVKPNGQQLRVVWPNKTSMVSHTYTQSLTLSVGDSDMKTGKAHTHTHTDTHTVTHTRAIHAPATRCIKTLI